MSIWSNNWKNQQNFIQDNQRVPVHTVLYIYIYIYIYKNLAIHHQVILIRYLKKKEKKEKREKSY